MMYFTLKYTRFSLSSREQSLAWTPDDVFGLKAEMHFYLFTNLVGLYIFLLDFPQNLLTMRRFQVFLSLKNWIHVKICWIEFMFKWVEFNSCLKMKNWIRVQLFWFYFMLKYIKFISFWNESNFIHVEACQLELMSKYIESVFMLKYVELNS